MEPAVDAASQLAHDNISPSKRRRSPSPPTSPNKHANTKVHASRPRRSSRLSGISVAGMNTSAKQDKENTPDLQSSNASTSAKTLEMIDAVQLQKLPTPSPRKVLPFPVSASSPARRVVHESMQILRDSVSVDDAEDSSSSDESDASDVVFFGQPSSAEKRKRVHYEQQVIQNRLRHKDSLDLARRKPINFNPDDTMLVNDTSGYPWSWNRPTPTPSRRALRDARELYSASPSKLRGGFSSPQKDLPQDLPLVEHCPAAAEVLVGVEAPVVSMTEEIITEATSLELKGNMANQDLDRQEDLITPAEIDPPSPDSDKSRSSETAMSSPTKTIEAPKDAQLLSHDPKRTTSHDQVQSSPSKAVSNTPRLNRSPVRSIDALIDATLRQSEQLRSPSRSPRRSPRLSQLQQQQQQQQRGEQMRSPSPRKLIGAAPTLLTGTPSAASYRAASLFAGPFAAVSATPSTGLSRFACLQNRIDASTPHVDSKTKADEPSPKRDPSSAAQVSVGATQASPERRAVTFVACSATSPDRQSAVVQTPVQTKTPTRPGQWLIPNTPTAHLLNLPVPASASAASPTKSSVQGKVEKRALDEATRTPVDVTPAQDEVSAEPSAAEPVTPKKATDEGEHSPLANSVGQTTIGATFTPGPIFRQTARRVPIQQHEAEFGVKLSPSKPGSPYKSKAKSSALRTQEPTIKTERIPARRVQVHAKAAAAAASTPVPESSAPQRPPSVASKTSRTPSQLGTRIGSRSVSETGAVLPASVLSRSTGATASTVSNTRPAATAAASRSASSASQSVAPKSSLADRPAAKTERSASQTSSPKKLAKPVSGLPRPAFASAPNSRLPRPASAAASASVAGARVAPRPMPMSLARLAPAQPGLLRSAPGISPSSTEITSSAAPEAAPKIPVVSRPAGVPAMTAPVASSPVMVTPIPVKSAIAPISAAREAGVAGGAKTSSVALGSVRRNVTVETVPAVSSSPEPETTAATTSSSEPVAKASSVSARAAPAVVLDPEQQRLRCLAMQERARKRKVKAADAEERVLSSDSDTNGGARSSPVQMDTDTPGDSAPSSEPSTLLSSSPPRQARGEGQTAATRVAHDVPHHTSANTTNTGVSAPHAPATTSMSSTTGRPLRSARLASRPQLTPSAQGIPPARGRTLSLNDIIAARKTDVPLTLTDQLKLADTVHKRANEKTLAKYKITVVQRPYERPPSPEQHVHEPEACVILDDCGSHRRGKGDVEPFSTPQKRAPFAGDERKPKSVRWYRPLFVDRGAHYGNTSSQPEKPVMKPVPYSLDRLGNKVVAGTSPKLTVGQPVVIYRNYFKGEPKPSDD